MADIEAGLTQLHARHREAGTAAPDGGSATPPVAFLQVTGVTEGSPAAEAGLRSGDQLAALGSVHADNFGSLADVAGVVRHSAGRALSLTALRDRVCLAAAWCPSTGLRGRRQGGWVPGLRGRQNVFGYQAWDVIPAMSVWVWFSPTRHLGAWM